MLKQNTVVVGGDSYMVTAMPGMKGINVLKRITRLAGPSFAALMSGEGTDDKSPIQIAVEALVDNFDKVEVEPLVMDLMSGVSKNNIAVNVDMEFAAQYDKLFKILTEVITLNYGSLFQNGGFVGNVLSTAVSPQGQAQD